MTKIFVPGDVFTADDANLMLQKADLPAAITRVCASAAARDTAWGVPASDTARRALQDSAATTVRTDTGLTERYYALYDAATNPRGAAQPGWYPTAARYGRGRVAGFSVATARTFLDFDALIRDQGGAVEYAAPRFKTLLPGVVHLSAHLALTTGGSAGWVNIALLRIRSGVTTRPRITYGAVYASPQGYATTHLETDLDVLPGDQFAFEFWASANTAGVPNGTDGIEYLTHIDLRYV